MILEAQLVDVVLEEIQRGLVRCVWRLLHEAAQAGRAFASPLVLEILEVFHSRRLPGARDKVVVLNSTVEVHFVAVH